MPLCTNPLFGLLSAYASALLRQSIVDSCLRLVKQRRASWDEPVPGDLALSTNGTQHSTVQHGFPDDIWSRQLLPAIEDKRPPSGMRTPFRLCWLLCQLCV